MKRFFEPWRAIDDRQFGAPQAARLEGEHGEVTDKTRS
jgi:hypothetical protein